ncbi:hypothetical protein F0562_030897 [Nyssa sinensis]|uniref:RRM domain-containing protein n=1 Tax=Nyssa sinensis TaxID=561372 RepID=A0A5J5AZV8_9ASTE|nr:hypothetical protein F0562_030897 [Nyssa sinensis]
MGGEGLHDNGNCNRSENEEDGSIITTTTGGKGETTTRIFVGGLGGSVTVDDLRKTFSSLGAVESVDIVRTKGRSFAYLDFLPSSNKALSKLFSTYNGCMWKGGRLRLEKAKEHYLLRLRRESAEDAELENSAPGHGFDAAENKGSSKDPKKVLHPENMQFRLFFPKFNKVKSLPFRGTGKHKYSFQRIEVPSLPIHFCDCEEHADPTQTNNEKHFHDLETQNCGLNDEELNMMNLVMSKLFERENVIKSVRAKEEDNSTKSVDNLLIDKNEVDYVADEDNLIMNLVVGGTDRKALLGSRGHKKLSVNEESKFNEPGTFKDRQTQDILKSQKRKIMPSNKKRKSTLTVESDGNTFVSAIPESQGSLRTNLNESETTLEAQITGPELGIQQSEANVSWSQKSAWRDLVSERRGNTQFHISHIMPTTAAAKEQLKSDCFNVPYFTQSNNQNLVKHGNLEIQSGQPKKRKELTETQPLQRKEVVTKLARGASWLKQSSWTQLVGETSNSSFSISQIMPGITYGKKELPEPNGMGSSTDSKHSNIVKSDISDSAGDGSKALHVADENLLTGPSTSNMVALGNKKQNHAGLDVQPSPPEKNLQTARENGEISAASVRGKHHSASKQTSVGDGAIYETFSFMRSAASMREWVNTKAALSGSIKKKGNEKSA